MSEFAEAAKEEAQEALALGSLSSSILGEESEHAAAVKADHDFIRANLPEAAIVSLTSQILTMVLCVIDGVALVKIESKRNVEQDIMSLDRNP